MPSQSVERAIMHGLKACLDAPVMRSKVSLAMRHTTVECRRTAAAEMIRRKLVVVEKGEKGARGPSPMMIRITDKGRREHDRLINDMNAASNTIWGGA